MPLVHPKEVRSVLQRERLLSRLDAICEVCAENAAFLDEHGSFPEEEFALLAEAGFLVAPLQRSYGGLGWGFETASFGELLMVLQRLGQANLVVGRLYEGHVNGLQLLQTFGRPSQIAGQARQVIEQQKIFGVWNAEAQDGVRLLPADSDKFRLQGAKTFCSGATRIHRPFVNGALAQGGWQMCLLPLDQVKTLPDPNWWITSGMRATQSYKIDFSGIEVDANMLIGAPDDYHRQPWLSAGAIRFAAVQFGGAQNLVTLTRSYLQALDRTRDALQADRMGKMTVLLETGRLWLEQAAHWVAQHHAQFGGLAEPGQRPVDETQRLVTRANMVRTAIEQISMAIIQHAERAVGARGLLAQWPLERVIRDLSFYLRQPGYDLAIQQIGMDAFAGGEPRTNTGEA